MGTDVLLIAAGPSSGRTSAPYFKAVEALFEREEQRFSRFRRDSELSLMNAAGGAKDLSPEMWDVLICAKRWWRETGGIFDPSVLPALLRAGYDAPFDTVSRRLRSGSLTGLPELRPLAWFQDVEMNGEDGHRDVRLENGVQVDLGGIVKGWTVDRAAEALAPLGDFLIDAGGDIAARGSCTDGDGWWVSVEDPLRPGEDSQMLLLKDRSVATSSSRRRRWRTAEGAQAHHLIDPGSGVPAETGVVSVTVTGGSAEACDVWAKATLIRGLEAGVRALEAADGFEGLITLDDGATLSTSGWEGRQHQQETVAAGT